MGTKLTTMEQPNTIHDFMGFPPKLFNVQCPANGEPALAGYTQSILDKCLVKLEDKWGLDH